MPRITSCLPATPSWSLVPSDAVTRNRQVVVETPSTVLVVRHAVRVPLDGKVALTPSMVHGVTRPRTTSGAVDTALYPA